MKLVVLNGLFKHGKVLEIGVVRYFHTRKGMRYSHPAIYLRPEYLGATVPLEELCVSTIVLRSHPRPSRRTQMVFS